MKKGLIATGDIDQLSGKEADGLIPAPAALFGTNARSEARCGKELLGWTPGTKSLESIIPRAIDLEAQKLGLTKL